MPSLRGAALLASLAAAAAGAEQWGSTLQAALQRIAKDKAQQYNCSIAIGARNGRGDAWAAADGISDFSSGRRAIPEDPFVLGSITKTFTGPAALQLVDRGIWQLDAPFAPLIDPLLRRAGRPALAEKFGPMAAGITLRQLLHMTAGVPDYDTSWNAGDPWRFRQYAHPKHDFGPLEIYDLLPGKLTSPPGAKQAYCSTNYILVGLALAQQAGAASWDLYDQASVVPKGLLHHTSFALTGPCAGFTPEHGYDRMGPPVRPQDPGMQGGRDVSEISCLGGWTAGNAIAPVADLAVWTEAVFGPREQVISRSMQELMKNTTVPPTSRGNFYGIAAFNLSLTSGLPWPQGEAWGHLGSTYGFQSISAFFPASGATVVVATNLEIRQQDAPSDALCSAYNSLLNHMQGRPMPTCKYHRSGYFFGTCQCTTREGPELQAEEIPALVI